MTMSQDRAKTTPREQFELFLKSKGKRCTPERFAILDKVVNMPGHFCAEQLAVELRVEGYPVSDATVYSALELLVCCGLAHKLRLCDRTSYYEYVRSENGVHFHTVCTSCGKIKEVSRPFINELLQQQAYTGFVPAYHSLVVYGTCTACRRRRKSKKDNK